MKKLLTIVAMIMTMLCGSAFLVSCSNNYKKMYLVVEYALPTEDGKDVNWLPLPTDEKGLDYVLSQDVYSSQENAHILLLRVKVKGTPKKVDSLYISQSVNNSTFLERNTVKPNESFKVLVKNIGSVRFTVTPSQAAEKQISFGVNVYKELSGISQNTNCVPALVTGGYIKLESLTNLINYAPLGQTNQTGVDFTIDGVGTLINDGNDNLIARTFALDENFVVSEDKNFIYKKSDKPALPEEPESPDNVENPDGAENPDNEGGVEESFDETKLDKHIQLVSTGGQLMLQVSPSYDLTTSNNVVRLKATSRYHNKDEGDKKSISTYVYVYIVENFTSTSLLVSYNKDVQLDQYNKLPTELATSQPVGDDITIYNSSIDKSVLGKEYNAIDVYTYTNASIYSYESNPGIKLNLFVDGEEYDYNDVVNNKYGIQISPISKEVNGTNKLLGLKFAVNPNSMTNKDSYNIRLELDFTAFDFSASDKAPVSVLNKEFIIRVESLASGIYINGQGYQNNLQQVEQGEDIFITEHNGTSQAKLYTSYNMPAIGMPLNIQATPTNAIDTKVYVSFYEKCKVVDGKLVTEGNLLTEVQLLESLGFGLTPKDGKFEINFTNKNKVVYLKFNKPEYAAALEQIAMVCEVACTPDSFGAEQTIYKKYITVISNIKVVGAIEDMYVYKEPDENIDDDTLTDKYLESGANNYAFINFKSDSVNVDLSEITITSANGNIKFSANEIDWFDSIVADKLVSVSPNQYKKLWFKTEKQCADSIVISSPNGVAKQLPYEFVNIVNADNVKIKYDESHIYNAGSDKLKLEIDATTSIDNISLNYLALQSSRTAQFRALGNGKSNAIKSVTAKTLLPNSAEISKLYRQDKDTKEWDDLYTTARSSFSASAIRVSNTGGHLFDISANSIGFTAILFVKVDFYEKDTDDKISLQSKYFVYEVAVYTPARDLKVNSDKDSIVYINDNYLETAKIDFNITLNSATPNIKFSSDVVNDAINLSYGEEGTASIYGIKVATVDWDEGYFDITGLNQYNGEFFASNSTKKFSVRALKDLQSLKNSGKEAIAIKMVIYQFGKASDITEITKVIYLGNYNKSESIIVASGVESYNNIYLSLLNGETSKDASREIVAYASNDKGDVTYKDLGFYLQQMNDKGSFADYSGDNLTITHNSDTNTFTVSAKNSGGVYQLVLYTQDSYDTTNPDKIVEFRIKITVSDGASDATAYLIRNLDEFVALGNNTEGKHYKLWQDIDMSALASKGWWDNSRDFKGTLNGAITIDDLNTGAKIYRCYTLMNLKISQYNLFGDANCFGLFSSVSGTIRNVVIDNATLDITLNASNTSISSIVNIGVITAINNGVIENCSVNLANSNINFTTRAQNTTYNMGLIAGLNNQTMSYANTTNGSNYSHLVDCANGGKLTINVEKGNSNFDKNTHFNFGGVVGCNAGTISANYSDNSSQSVRELITSVVNIELTICYDASNEPMDIESINLGGVSGLNQGTIKNIAISGSLVANDKVNLGGIAGTNAGTVIDVANYGAYINAYSYNDTIVDNSAKYSGGLIYHGNLANQEQNVGGIIGCNNSGVVDNVRTMFIHFAKDEVSVEAARSQICGLGNIGGIIGKASNTQLIRAYVENFVGDDTDEGGNIIYDYNIIGNNANVAGLIASSTETTVVLAFVQADFDVRGCAFYEFGKDLSDKYSYVYFIGDVFVLKENVDASKQLRNHNTNNDTSYIINKVIYIDTNVVSNTSVYGLDLIISKVGKENKINENLYIKWEQSSEQGVNNNYPYLTYKQTATDEYEYTLTIRPTGIIVNVTEKYFDNDATSFKKLDEKPENWETVYTNYYKLIDGKFVKIDDATAPSYEDCYELVENRLVKYNQGLYIQYNNDGNIEATAVVYYIKGGNNTHKLVYDGSAEQRGLIEKTILPTILSEKDGRYSVSIITGANIATLTDSDKTITFSGTGVVEIRFVSIFDRTKMDTVTIFVENPLNDDVFNIKASAGLEDRNQDGTRFTTRTNTSSLITIGLQDVDGQTFDINKTYMTYTFGDATTSEKDATTGEPVKILSNDVKNYLEFVARTSTVAGSGKYMLGQFEVNSKTLESKHSYIEVPVTIGVYLNLEKYTINGKTLNELTNQTNSLLAQRTITIVIYNKATELTVSSDAKAESGVAIDIEAKLKTGYVNTDPNNASGVVAYNIVGENGNKIVLDTPGQDKIDLVLSASNSNAENLLNTAKQNAENPDEFSIWHLFERNISYVRFDSKDGYTYILHLRLGENYRYLDLTNQTEREWKFDVKITSSSNTELSKTVNISFVPQQLNNFRIENYSNLVARSGNVNGTSEAEFDSRQPESSLIIPGESGLVKIFADYNYSYFEDISITSSREVIDGVEYFIRYQQMVYNKVRQIYESYSGITADGETLRLRKISYTNGDYEGVIFVRTILDEIVGVTKTFTITVNATTYDLDGNEIPVSRTKTVISQYRPGVYISVTDALISTVDNQEVYLVEHNSSITTIVAKVYGYEFNVQPIIKIVKLDGSVITDDKVVIIKQGDVETDSNGATIIKYSLAVYTDEAFKVSMKMTLIDKGNELTDESKTLIFYPVPYIVNNVYVKGEANGGLTIPVNTSKNLELVWDTKVTTNSKIDKINAEVAKLDYLKLFYINQTNSTGQEYKKYFTEYFNATNSSFSIRRNADNTYRIESLIKVESMLVHFNLWYGYEFSDNKVKVVFSSTKTETCSYLLTHEFNLHLIMRTTEDAPIPINTASDLLAMSQDENYILMQDITLENWTPLNTSIASLDGNGKLINIKSFNIAVENSLNVGLFGIVGENTILKNIVVNISNLENNLGTNATAIHIKNDNIANAKINFGLLAGVNNGLIYNCEIISIRGARHIEVVTGNGYTLMFGGLVGINNGNITNSRVGTEYFEQLSESSGAVSSAIIKCGEIYLKANGIMAGFVGENAVDSIISSCFVANTSVENTSNSGNSEQNRTAGFVANNAGTIAYSYVKGLERSILTTRARATGSVIYASGAGNVAGFAYMNEGDIHDCYSNIECKSNAAGVAGFVYNTVNGSVQQCYSASKVESGNTNTALATELPFVGVGIEKAEAQKLLSSANMINCYYLDDGTKYDTNYKKDVDVVEPRSLSLSGFANANNLNSFSFITDSPSEQQLNSVWTYSTGVDKNRSTYLLSSTYLPELTSANTISRSLRVYADVDNANNDERSYKYPAGYELGSKKNPYIIRSEVEYKNVFVDNAPSVEGKKYMTGYIRFVDNISFNVDNEFVNIDTRSNYILGDRNNRTFTLIDGNGMTISEVVINYTEEEDGSLGLFSEVYNSVIKALNVEYSTQLNASGGEVGSSTATYVGGIAGTAKNTYFIDLKLTGKVTLRAHNVVGGVVGRLTGENSGLYNISSNLTVQAGNYSASTTYKNEDTEVAYLSYAGGIAGIIDIGRDIETNRFNLDRLTVDSASIRANRAGGIAGFMGENVNAKRLSYIISSDSQIFGREIVGGMVAENFADIQLSQANSADWDTQYDYDKAFGEYINSEQLALNVSGTNANRYGNLNAITGDQIAGGFIGVNYGGTIENSLTKANIGHNNDYGMADIVGGFIGRTYGGELYCSYAQNYIDLVYNVPNADGGHTPHHASNVGGLVGHIAYNGKEESSKVGFNDVVAITWFDKQQIDDWNAMYDLLDESKQQQYNLDYIVGKMDDGVKACRDVEMVSPLVKYGVFNADEKDKNSYQGQKIQNHFSRDTQFRSAQSFSMEELYYIQTGDESTEVSTQQDIFNSVFASWPAKYWNKEYEKFTPNLILDGEGDYIIVDSAEDLHNINNNLSGHYLITKDITVDAEDCPNHIIYKGVFTGTIEGVLIGEPARNPIITVNLTPTTNWGPNAGFCQQSSNATFIGVDFDYQNLVLKGNEFNCVGGVVSQDGASSGGSNKSSHGSRFENITVKEGVVKTSGNASVSTLGSIVGSATHSQIDSCNSFLSYEVSSNTAGGNIGGLVGYLDGKNIEEVDGETLIKYEGYITRSLYSGNMEITSNKGVNVGGIVAEASYSRITDSRVALRDNKNTNDTKDDTFGNISIKINSVNNNYIGGIIGLSDMCSISGAKAELSVEDIEDGELLSSDDKTTYYVGGIVSRIKNSTQIDKSIDDSYAKLTFALAKAYNAYVGGIVAQQSSSTKIELNNLVSEVNIKAVENRTEFNVAQDIVKNMVLGGIVALAEGEEQLIKIGNENNYCTNINSSISILSCDIEYNGSLIAGGLIGKATGCYTINNSTSIGQLFANNEQGKHIEANADSSLTVMGGLVGLAGNVDSYVLIEKEIQQQILNSYTSLTISSASVYQGNTTDSEFTHEVYTNAIVGYTSGKNTITSIGVLYSSDYTLVFEEGNLNGRKFTNEPQNVTANMLVLYDETNNIEEYISGDWIRVDGHLPLPKAVQNTLISMGIITNKDNSVDVKFVEENEGKSYSPIIIDSQDTFDKRKEDFNGEDYRYYLLRQDIVVDESIEKINGVLLGNNRVVTLKQNLFEEIGKHSAVSNITFELISGFSGAGSASAINYGTVFMCGVNYNDIEVNDKFGGIVSENYGVVSYCYNIGIATGSGNIGGLVAYNAESASIDNSFFTGSFNGGTSGSALVVQSDGHIKSSYSAGLAKNIINVDATTSRYENVYYDYYANYVTKTNHKDLANKGILGKPTIEMQATSSQDGNSGLLTGWKSYGMLNIDEIKSSTSINPAITTTYNYGYPIHNIKQLTYDNGVKQIPIRIKPTGDGTFDLIVDSDGKAIRYNDSADEETKKNIVDQLTAKMKGKLVHDIDDEGYNIYYNNSSFLINNLGVLDLINKLEETADKYFELEIDITMLSKEEADNLMEEDQNKILSNWSGVGTISKPFSGVFTTSSSDFNSNSELIYQELDKTLIDEEVDDKTGINFNNNGKISENSSPKTVTNLTGGSLFNYVSSGALIANIILENSNVNNAPLINEVVYDSNTTTPTTVYNVKINGVNTNSDGAVSGLINIINENSTINVYGVDGDITISAYNEKSGKIANSVAGAININNGTINFKKSFENIGLTIENAQNSTISGFVKENGQYGKINIVDAISLTLKLESVEGVEMQSISGFVSINAGTIKTLNDNSKIIIDEGISPANDYIAGIVGTMENGQIGGFEVEFGGDDKDVNVAQKFGGVVAYLKGGSLGLRAKEGDDKAEDLPISVKLSVATADVFGGVVAVAEWEESQNNNASIQNVIITSDEQIVVNAKTGNGSAYGLIIGQYNSILSEIYYTLDEAISFKANNANNVGAIIGFAQKATFNFTNECPTQITTVYGLNNVGGFIGQYNGEATLNMQGNTWVVGASGEGENASEANAYASVEIACPEKPENAVVAGYGENFGGIIGYWNGKDEKANLTCSATTDKGLIPITMVNKNSVLSFTTLSTGNTEELSWFKNNPSNRINKCYDYVLSNIGGIVGKCNLNIKNATNEGVIGVEVDIEKENPHKGISPLYGVDLEDIEKETVINELMQFKNVGGIAGYITAQGIEGGLSVINCTNTTGIYGMYAVGGLVGGVSGTINIYNEAENSDEEGAESPTETADASSSIVLGLADVGGLVGKASIVKIGAPQDEGENTIEHKVVFGKVIAITNVGGAVGYAKDVNILNATIDGEESVIMGNMNVGGFIGYSDKCNIDSSTVSGITLYGTVFDYRYEIETATETEIKPFYYLPMNIGGVVGYVSGESVFTKVEAKSNVRTDKTYTNGISDIENVADPIVTVNMTTNYTGTIENIAAKTTIPDHKGVTFAKYLEDYYTTKLYKHDAVDGGIGGFAGRLNDVRFTIDGLTNSCSVFGNVRADYGINVGGIVGYLYSNPQISLPKFGQTINVAGKVFVGGYIGKTKGFDNPLLDFFGQFTLNEIGYVNIQKKYIRETEDDILEDSIMVGSGVGGIIGYVQGNVYNIKLTDAKGLGWDGSKIKIFNSNQGQLEMDSSYVGALIGRIDGNMANCLIDPNLCDAVWYDTATWKHEDEECSQWQYSPEYENIIGIIQSPKVYNYGGLVGIVNAKSNVTVVGTHYYAFTVDMVQNHDYSNGDTIYSYGKSNGYGVISAMAHYINQTNMTISISRLNDLYDGISSKVDGKFDHNPIDENTRGWAKEYTMFRMLARAITQDQDVGDSVQVIYNANYITEVGTTYSNDLKNENLLRRRMSDQIAYTIYKPNDQPAKLYCKQGIATVANDIDTTLPELEDCPSIAKSSNNQYYGNKLARHAYGTEICCKAKYHLVSFLNEVSVDEGGMSVSDILSHIDYKEYGLDAEAFCNLGLGSIIDVKLDGVNLDGLNYASKPYIYWFGGGLNIDDPEHKIPMDENGEYGLIYGVVGHGVKCEHKDIKSAGEGVTIGQYGTTIGYSYVTTESWWNALGNNHQTQSTDNEADNYYPNSAYIFETVFGTGCDINYEQNNDGKDKVAGEGFKTDSSYCSNSGSIFEVCGTQTKHKITIVGDDTVREKTDWRDVFWSYVAGAVQIVLGIILIEVGGWVLIGTGALTLVGATVGTAVNVSKFNTYLAKIALSALTVGSFGYSGSAFVVKMAGMETTFMSYNTIYNSSYGGLGTVYTRKVDYDSTNKMWNAESDDVLQVLVDTDINILIFKDPDGKILNGYFEYNNKRVKIEDVEIGKGSLKNSDFAGRTHLPISLGYISCGSGNSIPNNANEKLDLTRDEIAKTSEGGNNNYLCKILDSLDKPSVKIPKYVKINDELYMYANADTMTKKLYPNFNNPSIQGKIGDILERDVTVINKDGYAYASVKSSTDYLLNTDEEQAYIKDTYGIEAVTHQQLSYSIAEGSYIEKTEQTGLVRHLDINSMYWSQNPNPHNSPLDITIKLNQFVAYDNSDDVPNGRIYHKMDEYYYCKVVDGKITSASKDYTDDAEIKYIYLVPNGCGQDLVSGISAKIVTYTPYSGNSMNKSGVSSDEISKYAEGKEKESLGKDYRLEYKDKGKIKVNVAFYLYYPPISVDGTSWERVDSVNITYYDNDLTEHTIGPKELADELSNPSSEYHNYYINIHGDTIGEWYKSQPGETADGEPINVLYKKIVKKYYEPDEKQLDGVDYTFAYTLVPRESINGNNLNYYNKYVYTYMDSKGVEQPFHTRYYYGTANEFFKYKIDGKEIIEYLQSSDTLFSESVRFTISGCSVQRESGSVIQSATISCDLSVL